MAPANCAEGTGWMLISGDPARHEALQGQTLAMVLALASLLDEGIARGEGQLDVAAGVRVLE